MVERIVQKGLTKAAAAKEPKEQQHYTANCQDKTSRVKHYFEIYNFEGTNNCRHVGALVSGSDYAFDMLDHLGW